MQDPHKSPKVVDFVESAPSAKAISRLLPFPASGTAEMEGNPTKA